MPEYTLRNVEPELWSRFTERANREGWPIKALLVSLMEMYADGRVTPQKAAPKQLPEWGWLRSHYRDIAKREGFSTMTPDEQWELLVDHVVHSPAGAHYRVLDAVRKDRQVEILRWLRQTSNIELKHVLTLRAIAHIGYGVDLQSGRRAVQYEVLGLPDGHYAWIADFDGGWQLYLADDEAVSKWGQPHSTKEEAVETLARHFADVDPPLEPI